MQRSLVDVAVANLANASVAFRCVEITSASKSADPISSETNVSHLNENAVLQRLSFSASDPNNVGSNESSSSAWEAEDFTRFVNKDACIISYIAITS